MITLLCGKTCSGKDRIRTELVNLGFNPVITFTTRPMRDGEENGKTYHFVSKEEFKTLDSQGYFAETTSYNVADGNTWYYGTPIGDLHKSNAVLIVNPDGLKFYKSLETLDSLIIYLYADEEIIWNRLRQRKQDAEEARRRLEADRVDFENIMKYADVSIKNNGDLPPIDIACMIQDIAIRYKIGRTS